jgi:D-alanyl-D-alanine carboxypeptidase
MNGSHFANPHGLDAPEHFSTARDLAVLAAYAMQNPIFVQTVSTKNVTVGNRYLTNHNKLLWQVEGADGVKTGFTKAAGRILVSSAKRSGRRLICVTIDDGNDWLDHKTLYEEGFSHYRAEQIITCGQKLGTLQVFGGREDTVDVIAAEDFFFALAEHESVDTVLSNKGFVYAPAVAFADAGYAYICIDGKPVGKVKVVFDKTVEQMVPEKKSFWDRIFGGEQ